MSSARQSSSSVGLFRCFDMPVRNELVQIHIAGPEAHRTWDTIQEHFRRQMRDRHLLIWGTGMEHFWSIDVSFQPTRTSGFREVVGSIDAFGT